jgi:hypothetical protein
VGGICVGLVAGLAVGVVMVIVVVLLPRKKCPQCGTLLPRFRTPQNARQMLWGGWTCPQCGLALDRRGRKVER